MKNATLIILMALVLTFSCCTQNNTQDNRYEQMPTTTTIQNAITENSTDASADAGNCITANESWAKIGESACVKYMVTNAFKSSGGNIFLNEKSDYKKGFTTTIFASSSKNFNDPLNTYNYKTIQVTGLIRLYDGHPEIIAETASQIKIIE